MLGGEPVDDTTTLINDDTFLTADLIRTVIDTATDANDHISGNGAFDIVIGGGNDDALPLTASAVPQIDADTETLHGDENDDILIGDYVRMVLIDGVVRSVLSADRTDGGTDIIYGEGGQLP